MLTKLELSEFGHGFYTQRYYFENDTLVEEGARLMPCRSSRYFEVDKEDDVNDIVCGSKYHWGL